MDDGGNPALCWNDNPAERVIQGLEEMPGNCGITAPTAAQRWTEVLKTAEYHVGCGAFGIYAGTLNSKNKNLWQNKTECTDEALCAVRDYLIQECLGGLHGDKSSGGYEWTLKDGRVVKLLVVIVDGGGSDAAD
jgi:hypothetical protein